MSVEAGGTRFLSPDELPRLPGLSSVAVATGGRHVWIAGQVALDAELNLVGAGDFEAQARQVFTNVGLALAAVGLEFRHVVKLGMFVTDFQHLAVLRRVRDEFVSIAAPPTSTTVQVSAFFRPELMVEVEAVAVGPAET